MLKITAQILIVAIVMRSVISFSFAGDFEGYSGVLGTVDISVCGDGIVEGSEQCEPSVGILNSCIDYGYDKGELTCDSSCSYNISQCEYLPPKPSLPPYPNVFEEEPEEVPRILVPFFLTIYDVDGDGDINPTESCDGLTYWLKKWRIRILNSAPEGDIKRIAGEKDTCDLNFDKNCDLADFSIFLHNI